MRSSCTLPALLATLMSLTACRLGAVEATASPPDSPAARAAQTAPQCQALGDFYWEIGNADGVQASGRIGDDYSADEAIPIASASKFVWGAYVIEKLGGKTPSEEQVAYLEMKSGYTAFNPLRCLFSNSIASCLEARSNGKREAAHKGRFYYGGGHDQRMAVDMGLGGLDARALTREIMGTLGLLDAEIEYERPQLAGGLKATPAAYGQFLRKIVSGQLRFKQYLGYKPVCTDPASCPSAASSPAQAPWHYSLNHWIEDAPGGDGAFSSPGLMGFYPWISADKTTYGLLARKALSRTAYWDSVQCGQQIRAAWMQAH